MRNFAADACGEKFYSARRVSPDRVGDGNGRGSWDVDIRAVSNLDGGEEGLVCSSKERDRRYCRGHWASAGNRRANRETEVDGTARRTGRDNSSGRNGGGEEKCRWSH